MAKKESAKTTGETNKKGIMYRLAKIDKIPKTAQDSIPIRGFMKNGIIEISPGDFTKCYKLRDINFNIATEDEQEQIYLDYMSFLNSFNETVEWQIVIFNHEVDKRDTIQEIKIPPQKDGLNKYRQEMNGILIDNLKKSNNGIRQDKYLVVKIHDINADHAVKVLERLDMEISKKLKKICKTDTEPLSCIERMELLYNIYNQEGDYRFDTGVYDKNSGFQLEYLEKCGLSIKDIIGPESIDYRKDTMFVLNENTYAQALYLQRVPSTLSTNFIQDLGDIQSNMLISVHHSSMNTDKTIKTLRNNLASIEARISAVNSKNMNNGDFGAYLPPDLERAQKNARDWIADVTENDQKAFLVTMTMVVFAKTQAQLEANVRLVKATAAKHMCPVKEMKFQQEFCFNTTLPLCRMDINSELMLPTTSAAVFIPFNAQEINQKNAIFYGINKSSKGMLLYDRLSGDNYNALIFGGSGSGKSFAAKCEMVSVLLNKPNAQVFVIDPQGEYYPMTNALHGKRIELSPGTKNFLNPLDLDISSDEDDDSDPITAKSDFIISMFDIIVGKGRELDPIATSVLDKCTRKIFNPYIDYLRSKQKTFDASACPTLTDLYQELQEMSKHGDDTAGLLASVLYQYAVGSFDTFAHRTNIETQNARFVVYDTKRLGTGMKELGLFICTNDVWNRMIKNSKSGIYTWFYIDEFHVMLESENTTLFLKRVWKMARKWLGVPTGIMQNTEDLDRDANTRAILNNTSFMIILKQSLDDRQNLQALLRLSNSQLEYITESDKGHGLIYIGKACLPFKSEFPKNTQLYAIMSTAHDVNDAQFV